MNLSKEAQEAAKHTIDNMYGDRQSLSFVLPYLTQSQYSMELIHSINSFLEKENNLEIGIYTANNEWNYLVPFCSIFNVIDVKNKRTPKIIADPLSFSSTPIMNYDSVFYYVYDPMLLKITRKDVIQQIINCGCQFIAKNNHHKMLLKQEFGIQCHRQFVPHCEIELFKKIIYG